MFNLNYQRTRFIKSAIDIHHLPDDDGIEVAFVGYSNTGKSSALNTLTNQKKLARKSKIPGQTQLINLFEIQKGRRLVDLPGYGYAKVPKKIKQKWQQTTEEYLKKRLCSKRLVLIMDIRHPLKNLDQQIIQWATKNDISVLILLNKSDKISKSASRKQLNIVRKAIFIFDKKIQVEIFSSFKKQGLNKLRQKLDSWYSKNS